MKRTSTLLAFLLLTSIALTASAATTEKVERLDIVDRAIAFHGGHVLSNSETRLEMCSKSGCSAIEAMLDGDAYDLRAAATVREAERVVRAGLALDADSGDLHYPLGLLVAQARDDGGALSASAVTKLLSTFRISTGNSCTWLSEE